MIQTSWVGYPETDAHKASCYRSSGGIFSEQPGLLAHPNGLLRAATLPAAEGEALRAECEAAHLAEPFPDADVNVYAASIAHRERTGTAQWRAATAPDGIDPMSTDRGVRMAEKRYKDQLAVERYAPPPPLLCWRAA